MDFYYMRVSTQQQDLYRQEVEAKELKINSENIFSEKISGSIKNRPELKRLLSIVRKDDTIYFNEISRLSRNISHLIYFIDKLNSKGVNIVFLKEKLDTKTVLGKAMVLIIGIFAELDIENTKKRQTKGIERAKREGKYKGRKPIDTNTKLINTLYKEWKSGDLKSKDFMKALNLKRDTFYRRIKEYEDAAGITQAEKNLKAITNNINTQLKNKKNTQ